MKQWASVKGLDEMKTAMARPNSFELPLENITEMNLDRVRWGFDVSKLIIRWTKPSGVGQAALSIVGGITRGRVIRDLEEWVRAIEDTRRGEFQIPTVSEEDKKYMRQCRNCAKWIPNAAETCPECKARRDE
jgi:hypothetical protein